MPEENKKVLWEKVDKIKEALTELSIKEVALQEELTDTIITIAKETCPKHYFVQSLTVAPLYDSNGNGKTGIFAMPTQKPVYIGDSDSGAGVEIYCDEIDEKTRAYIRSRIEKAYEFYPDLLDKLHGNTRGLWEALEINNDKDIKEEISVEDI